MIRQLSKWAKNSLQNPLFRNGLIYITLTGVGSVINFLYNPLSGRLLPPEEYANLGILNAITLQFSAIFVALGLVVLKIFREYDGEQARVRFLATQKYVARILIILILFSIVLSPFIKSTLHLPEYTSLGLLVPYALLAIPIMFMGGYQQSRGAFVLMGSYTIFVASSKLAGAAVLLSTAPTLFSATLSLLLSQILGFIFLVLFTPRRLTLFHRSETKKQVVVNRSDKNFILSATLAIFSLLLLSNIDILLIKHRFDSESWQYIGPALLTNSIIFITTSISYVMVSYVKNLANWRHNRRTLLHSLSAWLLIVLPVITVVYFFAEAIIKYTIGDVYNNANTRDYMLLSTVLYSFIGLLYLLSSFLIAVTRHLTAVVIGVSTLTTSIIFGLHANSSINDLVTQLMIIVLTADLVVLFIVMKEFRSNEKTA